ncbi:MAG: hypothetical protein QHI48_08060 [Bacteroidota bacterium]|nr:hypothetical protein [Bacteroidota bacterium]
MKKLFLLIVRILCAKKNALDVTDEVDWEKLDGAEFFVVPSQALPKPPVDRSVREMPVTTA